MAMSMTSNRRMTVPNKRKAVTRIIKELEYINIKSHTRQITQAITYLTDYLIQTKAVKND